MLKLFCVCIFLVKYTNGLHDFKFKNEVANNRINDEEQRKMLTYFEKSSWSASSGPQLRYGSTFQSPVTIIKSPTIERTYRTEISVQQTSHPYLFQIMQMIPIKGQISFQYIYQKLFKFFIALKQFDLKILTAEKIIQILQFVFPELGNEIYEIAKYPMGPPMLKILFEIIFPQLPKQDLELIFRDVQTTQELIINLVLYLCPNIRSHFLWNENLPTNEKLSIILEILFPGEASIQLIKNSIQQQDLQNSIYIFLDLLFQGQLLPQTSQNPMEGPEWSTFQTILTQNNINYEIIPKEVLFHLYSTYKTPEFKIYLMQLKEKQIQENKKPLKMDTYTLTIWTQFLNDLKTHKKTLKDMPPEVKNLLEEYKNPQELIQLMAESIGFQLDQSKLNVPLDPTTLELWKKFIFDILNHKGDTTHLPKELLDYFNSLSQNPDYKYHLDVIFDTLSINPNIATKWNVFFDKVQNGQTTLDQMPEDLTKFLMNHHNPQEFLRIILKLKDSQINTNFLNVDTNPEIMELWKKYIEDVAINKGNIRKIPQKLLQYFYKISSNPANVEYIKLLFAPDEINPDTLIIWNQFINDLRSHKADLKDMPTEIIQLMMKYKSPDEFFKVLLPQSNIDVNLDAVPDETVKGQWINWISNLQHHNTSILDTPKELKQYFQKISPSQNFQTTLREIDSINPDLQNKWKLFQNDLKQHKKSMFTMPKDLKQYIIEMKTPKEFINLIFKTLNPPMDNPIPTPSADVVSSWREFLTGLTEDYILNGEIIDGVVFPQKLSIYLQEASENPNYQNTINSLYQMDSYVKNMFEDFKGTMLQDYSVTLDRMPEKLVYFFFKFDNLGDLLRSILSAYLSEFQIKQIPDNESYRVFAKSLIEFFRGHKTEIVPQIKYFLKLWTQNTPLGGQVQDIIKLHESNALVTRVINFWKETKEEVKVHDGIEVFIGFLDKLGDYYGNSEELCAERYRILQAVDRLRNSFAMKSECTADKYLTQ